MLADSAAVTRPRDQLAVAVADTFAQKRRLSHHVSWARLERFPCEGRAPVAANPGTARILPSRTIGASASQCPRYTASAVARFDASIRTCGIVLALILFVVEAARLDVYYDITDGCIVVSVPDDLDAETASRIGDVRVGMSLSEVEAILGPSTGETGTCANPSCTTYISQTIYFSAWPIHYVVGILPPVYRTTYYPIWKSGPSVRLGADGRVEEIWVIGRIDDCVVRIW